VGVGDFSDFGCEKKCVGRMEKKAERGAGSWYIYAGGY
jgi:hypothetical protein